MSIVKPMHPTCFQRTKVLVKKKTQNKLSRHAKIRKQQERERGMEPQQEDSLPFWFDTIIVIVAIIVFGHGFFVRAGGCRAVATVDASNVWLKQNLAVAKETAKEKEQIRGLPFFTGVVQTSSRLTRERYIRTFFGLTYMAAVPESGSVTFTGASWVMR